MNPFPEQYELIGFFEAEPELADEGLPWSYNSLYFKTTRGRDTINCNIEPGEGLLKLVWLQEGKSLMELNLSDIASLKICSNHGKEFLKAKFARQEQPDFNLWLKPHVRVIWV